MTLQELMASLMQYGEVLEWRRVEPRTGARLQVCHPHTLTGDRIAAISVAIAAAEGCELDWIEMLPATAR